MYPEWIEAEDQKDDMARIFVNSGFPQLAMNGSFHVVKSFAVAIAFASACTAPTPHMFTQGSQNRLSADSTGTLESLIPEGGSVEQIRVAFLPGIKESQPHQRATELGLVTFAFMFGHFHDRGSKYQPHCFRGKGRARVKSSWIL